MLPRRVDRLAIDLLIGATENEVAVAIEHHHRLGPAIERIDAILPIDGEAGDSRLCLLLAAALAAASSSAAGPPRRRHGLALRGWRRRLFQSEIHPRRQLGPVRDETIASVILCDA